MALLLSTLDNQLSTSAEPEGDKDLAIMRLQKIIAEQQMIEHLEYWRVREYERIRRNYQDLLGKIAEREKKTEKVPYALTP